MGLKKLTTQRREKTVVTTVVNGKSVAVEVDAGVIAQAIDNKQISQKASDRWVNKFSTTDERRKLEMYTSKN